MKWFDALRTRAKLFFDRAAAESRMDEEFRFHVEMETDANIRAGLPPGEARRRALVAFGGVERHKEGMRDERGGRSVTDAVGEHHVGGHAPGARTRTRRDGALERHLLPLPCQCTFPRGARDLHGGCGEHLGR